MTNHPNRSKVDALRKVCHLAGKAILETPRNGASCGKVRRELLNQIEDALIEAGYDMTAARANHNAVIKAERDAGVIKRDAAQVAKFPVGSRVEVCLYASAPNRLERGTVIEIGKKDMVKVKWEDREPTMISAYHLEHRP